MGLAFTTLVMTGCASFKAVEATGTLGQKIDGSVELGSPAELCRARHALNHLPVDPCKEFEAVGSRWNDVADAMVAYATQLSALAARDDVDAEDQVSAALAAASQAKWGTLTSDQNGEIASFAKAVVTALSVTYRAGVLDDVVKQTNQPLQGVGKLLADEADLRIHEIDSLSKTTADVSGALIALASVPAPTATPADAEPLERARAEQAAINQVFAESAAAGLVSSLRDLATRRAAYIELKADVLAFCAAHQKLADNLGNLTASELVPEVVSVAKAAYSLAVSLKQGAGPSAAKE